MPGSPRSLRSTLAPPRRALFGFGYSSVRDAVSLHCPRRTITSRIVTYHGRSARQGRQRHAASVREQPKLWLAAGDSPCLDLLAHCRTAGAEEKTGGRLHYSKSSLGSLLTMTPD